MLKRIQLTRAPRFGVFFRRIESPTTDLYFVYYWILRLGWLELRRWNDELVDLLEAAQEYTDSKPLNITPDDHGDQT